MSDPGLAAVQAWMQDRLIAGTSLGDADAMVVSSGALPADARIGIYAHSYVQRLAECLRAEFPVLRALIGDQVFNLFAGGYLSARPPGSWSLYHLGAGFADYLEATRPRPHSGPGTMDALPGSLARLERAWAESERAAGTENTAGEPPDLISDPGAQLGTPPSLVLLRSDFDFSATLASPRDGRRPPMPEPRETLIAVARSHYRVRAHTLEPWAFAWLEALGLNDGDVHAAIQAAARAGGGDGGVVLARLLIWLPAAVAAGFVVKSPGNGGGEVLSRPWAADS